MVLKKSKYGYNSGNTIRKRKIELIRKSSSSKGTSINNSTYYWNTSSFDGILNKLEEQANFYYQSSQIGKSYDVLDIKHWIEYFIERDEEIREGYFRRDYISTSTEDYVEELISAIHHLIHYKGRILSGDLNLGLDSKDAVKISLTVYNNGDLTDIGRIRYEFNTYPYIKIVKRIIEDKSIENLQQTWHNKCFRGIQRKRNVEQRFRVEEPDIE
jgi:hypothetical protein